MPTFSIITVVYNAESVLEATLQSLFLQTCTDYESIIIDGKSSDGTLHIVNKYRQHISKLLSEPDKGIFDAMNKGIKLATGKWLYFLNAGDKFASNDILQVIKENYLDDEKKIICGKVQVVDNVKNKTLNQFYPRFKVQGNNFRRMFVSALCHQALFVTKDAYGITDGFNTNFKVFADFDSVIKILQKGYSINYINQLIGFYDINGGSANWRNARKLYHEKELILSHAGQKKKFPLNILGLLKLEFFMFRKKITNAEFK